MVKTKQPLVQSNNKGRLGVTMVADQYFEEVANERNLNVTDGVIIDDVQDGSAAQYAGLIPNDVILKINNNSVSSTVDVRNTIAQTKAGEILKMTIFRNGKTKNVDVTLKS